MLYTKDVHYKVGKSMSENGYFEMNDEEKKTLTIQQLKIYIVSKLSEISEVDKKSYEELEIIDIFKILYSVVPKEEHHEVLSQIIHCLLNIAGTIQGYEIVWWQHSDDELINNSIADFDETGHWDSIKTHENTDYDKVFEFVYDVFMNSFMKRNDYIC